jgi:hypothetical protein
VHNIRNDHPTVGKVVYWMMGGYGGLKTNLLDRIAARDRAALRESLQLISTWEFDRIVMSHGSVFEGNARAALQKAYGWALA